MPVTAVYFDGQQARRHEVMLSLDGDVLLLQGDAVERRVSLSALKIPPPLGNTPRLILFADGARCEIADNQGFAAMLPHAAASWLSGMENSWLYAMAALLLTLVLAAVAYLWGLPYAAREVADRLPDYVLVQMDNQFFASLDQTLLKPTALAPDRRQALGERLQGMSLPPGGVRPNRIEFRGSPGLGANAFALPGGSVVVLDQLVDLADNDEEVIAVLAHEMGHVSQRHAMRQMLQASVIGLAMAWYIGDVSSLLAAAPTALLQTRYSRDLERTADAFAADMLRINGIPVSRLADMLRKLEASHRPDATKTEKAELMIDYLSTHPNTEERIKSLRGR
ncbi:MAG: M48 family metallopeptidase [Methylococcaceae bacterium]|nr:M48 family metallopeptidase [Methylococcaceae bacterium]